MKGHFKAEEWNGETNQYILNAGMGIKITVDVFPPTKTTNRRKHSIMTIEWLVKNRAQMGGLLLRLPNPENINYASKLQGQVDGLVILM